jgi:hypothetical protein
VLNVNERGNLGAFVNLIRNFKVSKSLIAKAQKLRFPLRLIKTTKELESVLEQPNWRNWPMVFDVPAASQVFGNIVVNAGIEGILYRSVLTQRDCIAIFPQNFVNSSSFIEFADPIPSGVQSRIDSSNFGSII